MSVRIRRRGKVQEEVEISLPFSLDGNAPGRCPVVARVCSLPLTAERRAD